MKEEQIAAPVDIVFETILEQMGPLNATPEKQMPMKLEAWPGGRWFRDLGNNAGHFWGVVQAIKPPSLLEISGPLFMSTPAVSNIQYRLTEENGVTHLRFVHRAMGWITERGPWSGRRLDPPDQPDSRRGTEQTIRSQPKCPMCLETMVANIGWIAAGATSTGGISALVIKTLPHCERGNPQDKCNKGRNKWTGTRRLR